LTLRLNEFRQFIRSKRIKDIQSVDYSHLSAFVADYKSPSVHVKKARVWSLHQFFHLLILHGHIKENIAMDLPYPKIEKTVPYFLTIEEYNRILAHCADLATDLLGLRNLIIIMMLGILGLRTGTIVSMNISPRTLQDIFRNISESCGIDKHLHAHLFRHTAATHLNRVAGTTITQHVLGHSLRRNTHKYTHLNPDQYAVYMKKHPFMNL
jgi:site-specific recombinase XerD